MECGIRSYGYGKLWPFRVLRRSEVTLLTSGTNVIGDAEVCSSVALFHHCRRPVFLRFVSYHDG